MTSNGTPRDSVGALWRYPVKSMQGEPILATHVTGRGLAGDRNYALVDKATNRTAVVRTWAAALFTYQARYDTEPAPDAAPPPVRITGPGGETVTSSQPDAEAHLSAAFGRTLSLMTQAPAGLMVEFPAGTLGGTLAQVTELPLAGAAPAGTFFDLACVHLVATSTMAHLGIDVRRLRPNIVVKTDAPPFVENTWVGRRLAIGDAMVLKISLPTPRCVNMTMAQAGLPREGGLLKAVARQNSQDLGEFGRLPCLGAYADVIQPGHIGVGDMLRWLD